MFSEENWWVPDVILGNTYVALNDGLLCGAGGDSLGTFHEGVVNAVFLDGHGELIRWFSQDPQAVNTYYFSPSFSDQ
jgi:prepilin-type processing-associated H-X9-DG protein